MTDQAVILGLDPRIHHRSTPALGRVGFETTTDQLGTAGCAVKAVVATGANLGTRSVLRFVEAARGAFIAALEALTRTVAEAVTLGAIPLETVVLSAKATVRPRRWSCQPPWGLCSKRGITDCP